MLKYHVRSRKSPLDQSVKYYAQIASPDPVSLEAIAKMIAQTCTLTRHDIVACLSAFQEQLINMLQEGKSVKLDELGSFRVTLHSQGTELKEKFTSANVKGIRIRFTPAPRLRKALSIGADGIVLAALDKLKVPAVVPPKEPGSGDGGESLI